jgi:hypothetical protein
MSVWSTVFLFKDFILKWYMENNVTLRYQFYIFPKWEIRTGQSFDTVMHQYMDLMFLIFRLTRITATFYVNNILAVELDCLVSSQANP